MSKLTDKAAAEAQLYSGSYLVNSDIESARDDFYAGYVKAAMDAEEKLSFARQQLSQMMDLASKEGEHYCLSIAKYTLGRLK